MYPKVSIITITYNSELYLEQTIQSIINQTYQCKEYIIIDGASTDSTLSIIKKYEDKIDKWVSEPDNGIADAMNKGLALAMGDFVIFLHSDDYFVDDNVLSVAASHLTNGYEVFFFSISLSNNGEKRLAKPRGFNWWLNLKTGVFHQSVICARTLFERIGDFDTGFRIAMDYDFFLRAYRARVKTKKIDLPLSVMRLCGVSSQLDWPSLRERFREEHLVHIKNCPLIWQRPLYYMYSLVYKFYRYCKSLS
ncbi:MAG: glycosyltransferase [Deltaproteobacteria bacterium]|nr:glycosyltransferase [Deltaproteobacteria bacterium]